MRTASIVRSLAALAIAGLSLPALADNCAKLAQKTMCITASNNWGGTWAMNASFGAYDPDMQDGPATIGGNSSSYRCVGNNFALITINDSTGDRLVWTALVAAKAKSADGTGTSSPSEAYFRYKAVAGACPAN